MTNKSIKQLGIGILMLSNIMHIGAAASSQWSLGNVAQYALYGENEEIRNLKEKLQAKDHAEIKQEKSRLLFKDLQKNHGFKKDRVKTKPTALNNATINSFEEWRNLCQNLPIYKPDTPYTERPFDTPLSKKVFFDELSRFNSTMTRTLQNRNTCQWLGNLPPKSFYDLSIDSEFEPYVQRLILKNGTDCAFHGDIHGDIHSLIGFLSYLTNNKILGGENGFKVVDEKFKIFFLGDYTDRGWYGAEVLYTIFKLKNENPDQVILVRGNHEEASTNIKYGLHEELLNKFGLELHETTDIYRVYNYLPIALFLGSDQHNKFILCCHGGLEIGFDPKDLLACKKEINNINQLFGKSMQRTNFNCLNEEAQQAIKDAISPNNINDLMEDFIPVSPIEGITIRNSREANPNNPYIVNQVSSSSNGFMWNDVIVNQDGDNIQHAKYSNGRGWAFGKLVSHAIMDFYTTKLAQVVAVFRAHQHGDTDMMQSIYNIDSKSRPGDTGISKLWRDKSTPNDESAKLWPGVICTFAVCPNSETIMHKEFNERVLAEKHTENNTGECLKDHEKNWTPYTHFNAFGILNTDGPFENWRLNAVRVYPDGTDVPFDALPGVAKNGDPIRPDESNLAASSSSSSAASSK